MNFSTDASQSCLYVGDNSNMTIYILNRSNLQELGRLGRSGRETGELHWLHQVSVDSQGNIYTGEVRELARGERPEGTVSSQLHALLKVGSRLLVGSPFGNFTPAIERTRPLVLLSAGVGVTMPATLAASALALTACASNTLRCEGGT